MNGYIGTYTKHYGRGRANGIYGFTLNDTNGELESLECIADIPDPSWLALSSDKKFLYAVNELDKNDGKGTGGTVTAFSISEDPAGLKLINRQSSEGGSPCHIALSGKMAVTANYGNGIISLFNIDEKGSLSVAKQKIILTGSGPDKTRQGSSHAHSFYFTPDKQYGYACDLGGDKIMVYEVKNGSLALSQEFSVNPGAGPRHGVFHPSGNFFYCVNELDSTIDALACSGGALRRIQNISTLPSNAVIPNTTAAIKITPDSRFIYASNRGHDSIAIFKIRDNGMLEPFIRIPSGGKTPRDFAIDNSGRFLLVCNQDSDNLTIFSIDKNSGMPEKIREYSMPSGVCIVFRS